MWTLRVPRPPTLCALALVAGLATTRAGAATLDNLQTAYNLEVNAGEQYEAYATQATAEGYHKVASLFRAAARAEKIHASLHAAQIRRLGGAPEATVEAPVVRGTSDNLSMAIARESYERDRLYALFAVSARRESCGEAEQAFCLARNAECQHAKLFSEARSGLKLMRRAQAFYLCPGCGALMVEREPAGCESCGGDGAAFLTMN